MEKIRIVVNEDKLNANELRMALQWCQGMEEYHICKYLDAKGRKLCNGRDYLEGFHCGKADGISYVLEYLERVGIIKREVIDEDQ
jgi:hypothetical protein